MGRRILIAIVVIVLVVAGVYSYRHYEATKTLDSGAVTCVGCMTPEQSARFDREDHGEDPDGNSERKRDLSKTVSQPTAPEGFPPVAGSTTNQPPQPQANMNANSTTPPVADTVTPNPPNGMVFAGTGSYQWYRQGNLTWRVNTTTGSSCIVYATMEEWRKPIVMSHGCGRNA